MYKDCDSVFDTTCEYVQSAMACSSFYADMDIVPMASLYRDDLSPTAMARDTIESIDNVTRHVFGFTPEVHYVFLSRDDSGATRKIGMHVHSVWPPGTCTSTRANSDLAAILEITRFAYPDTIGATARDTRVFDQAVYPHGNPDTGAPT